MSMAIKIVVLIMLTYFWAKGMTIEYKDRIRMLEDELKRQKEIHEEEIAELELIIKLMELRDNG